MELVNSALEPLPQESLDPLIGLAAGTAVGRLTMDHLNAKFTTMSGVGGEEGSQRMEALRATYQLHADKAVTAKFGLDAGDLEAFWSYAKEKHQGQLMEAVQKQLRGQDVSGYAPIVRQFMTSNAPSIEALQRAGLQVRKSSHKGHGHEVYIAKAGAGWMSIGSAAKAGLI